MLRVKDLLRYTAKHPVTDIIKNSRNVSLKFKKVEFYEDQDGEVFREMEVVARDKTIPRKMTFRFWGEGENPHCWCQCSCEWFLFHCEYALAEEGSSDIKYSNGQPPDITNSDQVPYVCKHIAAALRAGAHKRQRATRKSYKFPRRKIQK